MVDKEICWWNGEAHKCVAASEGPMLEQYTRFFDHIALQSLHSGLENINNSDEKSWHNIVSADFCPTYFKLHRRRETDPLNLKNGTSVPVYLLAHLMKYLLPDVKLIFMLREPTTKALSQFIMSSYNHGLPLHADAFHNLCIREIAWFKQCVQHYSVQNCLYSRGCNSEFEHQYENCNFLLSGLYNEYIEKWLEVFHAKTCFLLILRSTIQIRGISLKTKFFLFYSLINSTQNHFK